MKPTLPNSNIFDAFQDVSGNVKVWNCMQTGGYLANGTEFVSKGMTYRPATAKDTFGASFSFATATLAQYTSHFDANTTPGLVNENGTEAYGRIPLIHDYWGTGTPVGVSAPNAVVLRFHGVIRTSGTYALLFAGSGNIKIFHNTTAVTPLTDATSGSVTSATAFKSYTAGDTVDIFFWAINKPWGGISLRVCTSTSVLDAQSKLVWGVVREQDFLGSAWMDDGEAVTSEVLKDVVSVSAEYRQDQVSQLGVELALSSPGEAIGWVYDPSLHQAVNNQTGFVMRKGNRISFDGGVASQLYREFTGYIDDIIPGTQTISIKAVGFETRLARQLSENYPDRISYAGFGYTKREGFSEPVWNVPAYDNWPYEHALKDLCSRAWIDPTLLNGKKQLIRVGQSSVEDGASLFYCRTLSGKLIRISRQPHYGNPLANPDKPADDPYLTPSEITTKVYQRIKDLASKIGYDFQTNARGQVVFRPVNNPIALTSLVDITGGATVVHPSAVGGKYQQFSGPSWEYISPAIKASRIDLLISLAPGLGTIAINVERAEDGAQFDLVFSLAHADEVLFYDRRTDVDGNNICALTILSGEQYGTYTVTVDPLSGTTFRLDAFRVFEQDPTTPTTQASLRTLVNALEVTSRSNATDRLNDAVVTGKLHSVLTDSTKVLDNVPQEYLVSRAQDIHSILNPAATNYFGGKITAYLSDDSISEQDLADWTATNLVTTYRQPKPDITVKHTAIPTLELRDPMYAKDDVLNTTDNSVVLWVTGWQTTYQFGDKPSALSTIEFTPFIATPSYEPQEEIDISLYFNKPVINLKIAYTNLTANSILNPGKNAAAAVVASDRVAVVANILQDGTGLFITIPADTWSPGSELLTLNSTAQAFKNFPYATFYNRSSSTRLDIVATGGDGTSAYNAISYGLTVGEEITFSYIKARDAYAGVPPFYDPYVSELNPPALITVSYDALVSGYYRVSIVDARGNGGVVAWLTEPTVSDADQRKHWTYMAAGKAKTFKWDAVDTVGKWNKTQTSDSLTTLKGAFQEIADRFEIGKGFYVQNDKNAGLVHISAELVSGEMAYPVGKYAQFYIKVECIRLEAEDILIVKSSNGSDVSTAVPDLYNTNAIAQPARFVYTHLHPQCNRITTDIQDWVATGGYDPNAPGSSWGTTPDTDATIRDDKPIKLAIAAVARRGTVFGNDTANVNVKVHRVTHLLGVGFDQSINYLGKVWNAKSTAEAKRVLNRRTINDNHTIVLKDGDFTKGSELLDWTFYPTLFEDDFGNGTEPISYLKYSQLFETPNWNPNRFSGEMRSRYNIGYMAYLFYFSVFVQDRSGRLAWSIDTTHTDKSKILTNSTAMQWPFDLERHQRRVIYTRQWWDTSRLASAYGASAWNVTEQFRGCFADRMDPWDTSSIKLYPRNDTTTVSGNLVTGYQDPSANLLRGFSNSPLPTSASYNIDRDFGNTSTTVLGNWSWENDGFQWVPNPSRDFHPFYLCPPMGLCSRRFSVDSKLVPYWSNKNMYGVTQYFGSGPQSKADEAAFDTWFATANTYTAAPNELTSGRNIASVHLDKNSKPTQVSNEEADYQRVDDLVRYEECRGSFSNGPFPSRDIVNKAGGDPYYFNPIMYRHFRKGRTPTDNLNIVDEYRNDIYEQGFFQITFRHTYAWESATYFPVSPSHRVFVPSAIDKDLTGRTDSISAFDPGAYAGWKDDHPSTLEASGAFKEATKTCATIHWRYDNDGATGYAGGSCPIDNPAVQLSNDLFDVNHYDTGKNIFIYDTPPFAVGPRLPETRRLLLALSLVNERRTVPVVL